MAATKKASYWDEALPLDNLRRKSEAACRACKSCSLGDRSKRVLLGNADEGKADVLMVLGTRDPGAAANKLLSAASFGVLNDGLKAAGLSLDNVRLTPVTACLPIKPETDKFNREIVIAEKHINACKGRILHELLRVDPLIVVALGTAAIKALFSGVKPSLEEQAGNVLDAVRQGVYVPIHFPVLIVENPVLISRFPSSNSEGSKATFLTAMAELGKLLEQLRKLRGENQ
jgi:uracil-DNA glycosylase